MTPTAPPPTWRMIVQGMADIIATVDAHAREKNRIWGFNRLPHIVPIEWTERFKSQKHKYELACFECTGAHRPEDLARVRQHGEAMIRAYNKLEDVAIANGMAPMPPGVWEFELPDGRPIVLVRSSSERSSDWAKEREGHAMVWSLEEIANIIMTIPEICDTKAMFPDAEVIQMKTRKLVDDEIDDLLAEVPF